MHGRSAKRSEERVADAEISAKLQAPVIGQCTQDERPRKWGFPGVSPGPLFRPFLAVQKGPRVGTRNPLYDEFKGITLKTK